LGKIFDNATSCSSENSLVIQTAVFDLMVNNLKGLGGHLCTAQEKELLKKAMWPDGAHLSKEVVGQPAQKIAQVAGIKVTAEIKFLMVLGEAVGTADMFSGEKLSPVLTIWKYDNFDAAVKLVLDITRYSGYGHSCGIHSNNQEHIMQLATKACVSRMMVRQTQAYANSGNYDNGMPFALTLGCGTWGGNITSENVHWKHFINTTWVSMPIQPVLPDENVIFGAHWNKYGKV
jgi:sulfoacetaldehyde dehydrogenase